jgi:hypothetical protein
MALCISCGKKSVIRTWSRHQKGSSGASEWPLRAQISKKPQHPNLHTFKGNKYCTKCLRKAKAVYRSKASSSVSTQAAL